VKRKEILKQFEYCANLVPSELIFHNDLLLFPVHLSDLIGHDFWCNEVKMKSINSQQSFLIEKIQIYEEANFVRVAIKHLAQMYALSV